MSEPERKAEVESSTSAALSSFSVAAIQHMGTKDLLRVQSVLRHGNTFGTWDTPRTWFPGGRSALWSIDLFARVVDALPESLRALVGDDLAPHPYLTQLLDRAILSMTRYLVLCRIGPVGMSRRTALRPLDPSSVAQHAYIYLPSLAALSVVKAFNAPKTAASRLSADAAHSFARLEDQDVSGLGCTCRTTDALKLEMTRMRSLHDRGLWADAPAPLASAAKTTRVVGKPATADNPPRPTPHLPLPDDYVSEMGRKSGWLIAHLGPNILRALQDFKAIWKQAADDDIWEQAVSRRTAAHLAQFNWVDADGQRIEAPPFPLRLSQLGTRAEQRSAWETEGQLPWPPSRLAHLFGLAQALQGAHIFVMGLSTGARCAELLTLERDCVVYAKDGERYADGRTYKLVQRHDGEERDWTLPDFALQAIEQQARLVSLYECLTQANQLQDPDVMAPGTHLWGLVGGTTDRSKPMQGQSLHAALKTYARDIGMATNPGGQPMRPHRLRKTLARLVALAITHAPKILQDVFGHKSIEMTLYYILTDKDLAAEIETIAAELRVMRAQTVVSEIAAAEEGLAALNAAIGDEPSTVERLHLGGYGGAAALNVDKAIRMHRDETHRRGENWGAEDVRELAEILTMQGKTWQLVRPGVLCTKSIGQAGPCNKKKGHPEPARCQTHCDHRLEEAWHREDVDHCIAESVRLYAEESEKGEDLVAAHWAGQVRAHVGRFPDLRTKWMKDSRVLKIVEGPRA